MDKIQFAILFSIGFLTYELGWRHKTTLVAWFRKLRKFAVKGIGRGGSRELRVSKYEKTIDPLLEERKPHAIWNTVIFFPQDQVYQGSTKNQLLYYFENAKVIIRICVQLSSLYEIRDIVLRKKKEGLLIQVITDYDTLTAHNNWNAKSYVRAGIEVRARNTGSLMHNKFVIFDDEAVMTGSLNQTKQGVDGNHENVILTTNSKIVSLYNREFANIWNKTDEVKRSTFQ